MSLPDDTARAALPWSSDQAAAQQDAFDKLRPLSKAKARRARDAVEKLRAAIDLGMSRASAIVAVAARCSTSARSLDRYDALVRGHDPRDWMLVLAPEYARAGRPKVEISPDALKFITAGYLIPNGRPLSETTREARRVGGPLGWVIPCDKTVKRCIDRKVTKAEQVFMRDGERASDRLRPGLEIDNDDLQLHERWVADGRQADVWVLMDGKPVRPTVVLFLESRTSLPVGWAIGTSENTDLVQEAFQNALKRTNRVLPQTALFDNGSAFRSERVMGGSTGGGFRKVRDGEANGFLTELGVKVKLSLPGKPHSGGKGQIESFWNAVADGVDKDPMFRNVYQDPKTKELIEGASPDNAGPVDNYKKRLEEFIYEKSTRGHRGISMGGRSPLAVYEELLSCAMHLRQASANQIALALMARKIASVSRSGHYVTVFGSRFFSPWMENLSPSLKLTVHYDASALDQGVWIGDGLTISGHAEVIQTTGAKSHAKHRAKERTAKARRDATKELQRAVAAEAAEIAWPDEAPSEQPLPPAPLPPAKSVALVRPKSPLRADPQADAEYRRMLTQGMKRVA